MQKKQKFWAITAIAAAAAVTIYYIRKKSAPLEHHKRNGRHITNAFAKAKGYTGEFTL